MNLEKNSINSYSEIKKTALILLNIIDDMAQPHLKNAMIKRFWNWFFLSHGKTVITNSNDNDLKIVMKKGYESLKPIYEKTNLAMDIKEAGKINDGKMQEFVKTRLGKGVLDLIP